MLLFLPELDAQGMQLVREKGEIQGRTLLGKLSGAGGMVGRFEKNVWIVLIGKEELTFVGCDKFCINSVRLAEGRLI